MSFFLLIVLGVIAVGTYKGVSARKALPMKNNGTMKNWKHIAVNSKMEKEYNERILQYSFAEEIYNELAPVVMSFAGAPQNFKNIQDFFNYMRYLNGMDLRMYMASRGFLPQIDIANGIDSVDIVDEKSLNAWRVQRQCMEWVNFHMMSRGICQLSFVKKTDLYKYKTNKSLAATVEFLMDEEKIRYYWCP